MRERILFYYGEWSPRVEKAGPWFNWVERCEHILTTHRFLANNSPSIEKDLRHVRTMWKKDLDLDSAWHNYSKFFTDLALDIERLHKLFNTPRNHRGECMEELREWAIGWWPKFRDVGREVHLRG